MENKIIEKVIRDGNALAEKMRNSKSLAEITALKKTVDEYSEFVDEHFGVIGDLDYKECAITIYLYVAYNERKGALEYPEDKFQHRLGETFIEDFVKFVNSQTWIHESYGIPVE